MRDAHVLLAVLAGAIFLLAFWPCRFLAAYDEPTRQAYLRDADPVPPGTTTGLASNSTDTPPSS